MKRLIIASVLLLSFPVLLFISSTTAAEADISGECRMSCVCDGEGVRCQRDHGEYFDENNNKILCSIKSIEGDSMIYRRFEKLLRFNPKVKPTMPPKSLIYCKGNEPAEGEMP